MISIVSRLSLAAMLVSVLASCSLISGADKEKIIFERPNGTDIVLIPENFVASYITSAANNERNCLAPSPDVADSSADSLKLSDAADTAGFTHGVTATGLGQSSANLLLAREMLYRACELTSNLNADLEDTKTIYNSFLKVIVDISTAGKAQ